MTQDLSGWVPNLLGVLGLQGSGVPVAALRSTLNFVGCTVVDNPGQLRTDITPPGAAVSTLVGDGTNYSNISGANGIKYTGNPKAVGWDVPINALTPTSGATAIYTFATTTNRAYSVRGIIRCQDSTVATYGEWEINAFCKNTSGALSVITGSPVTQKQNTSSFVLTFTAVGTNLVVTATDPLTGRRWTGDLFLAESAF